MYRYKQADQRLVEDRVAQFRDQMTRFLDGRLGEDEFRPLRLQKIGRASCRERVSSPV